MTDLTFVYFKMRALGEAPQMMLHYRNQPYRYMMGWEYFGKPWPDAKRGAAFRQLPMLVTEDGAQITQTGAIMRYLAGRLDLMPPDPLAAAQADEVFDHARPAFPSFMPVSPISSCCWRAMAARSSLAAIPVTVISAPSTISIWRISWTRPFWKTTRA